MNYQIWDRDEIERVHHATLKVLQNVGIRVASDEALEILSSAGVDIKREKSGVGVVRFPGHVVEGALNSAPKSVIYHGRDKSKDFDTTTGQIGFSTFGECVKIIDPYTRELRSTSKEDCGNTGKIVDYFDELKVMERAVCSCDKKPATQPLHNLETLLKNTSKHIIIGAGTRDNLKVMCQMAEAAAGGEKIFSERPIMTISVCPSSPLTLSKKTCEIIIDTSRAGLGMWLISMVLAGGTGPVTLAGTVVQHNAEILSALVLTQLCQKGAPCTYGSSSSIMSLKNGAAVMGGPEYGMLGVAISQMAKFYGLPSAIASGVSESKTLDIQSAYESALNFTQVTLARPSIVYGIGSIENGLTFDHAKVVMDCELIRHLEIAVDGITVDQYHLAAEQIESIGPGGTYLLEKQTYDNMRKQSDVKLFDRKSRDNWEKDGSPQVVEKAYQMAIDIIETHQVKPLPEGAENSIDKLVHEYEEKLRQEMSSENQNN